jgi:hypothetical protein
MIRLLTVIGHGVNLLPHFIKHYEKYVDEIQIAVYETDNYPNLNKEILDIIKDYNNIKIVMKIKDRIFDWERVTQLYNFVKSKKPNDWWVISDIDEFHLYPDDDIKTLVDECDRNGWDVVRGGFIDRTAFDGSFPEIVDDVPLFEQFPAMGFFRYPMSLACPNKICVVKGYVEITPGQHYAKINGDTTWKWQGWSHPLINPNAFVQVHHFKWDKTCVDRIKLVADNKQKYSFSDEYKLMYDRLKETKFKVDTTKPEYMFESSDGQAEYKRYNGWNKLINKIKSI